MRHRFYTVVALGLVLALPRQSPGQTAPGQTAPPAQTPPAQTPPGPPLPASPAPPAASSSTETRPDFSGTWKLDRSISNDPAKASFEPERARTSQRPGGFGGSRRGGRGGFGGGGGGFGGGSNSPSRDTTDDRTLEERTRLQALTEQIRAASATLVISHHDPTFVVNDALDHTQFFQTDDSASDHQVGAATIATTTHWEGPHLVTEYTLSSRQKLVFTYTLLAATKQMVLRARVDDTERRRVISRELKLVYGLAPSAPK